ncbi:D-alanyl-D-alanine carboxypeptidase [Candidatus Uhrbacteria bacterium]|jgi:serine-type D-Ala-D-Ala endopeptidase (penicillin-binding protein 7)|nr:D-alanyl-D-alanine carboxypeptidase [Candidatus Uhrbacteria bacterium]MBT7716788.1 D-alanyl-D-alanine carboxypeptidase [Candidatus Uhrbacteria bacterium]
MILKVIGQILVAASLVQVFPTDASVFEYQVGEGDFEQTIMSAAELEVAYSVLPEADSRDYPVKVDLDSYGIVTTAWSAVVIDDSSGAVLFQKHPDALRSIGSVTKLMAALVFLEQNPDLSQTVTLDPDLDYVGGGRLYLGYFNGLLLSDVLAASLVGSDNTATQSLIRFSGLSSADFMARMNTKADELGMDQTEFYDATGLDARNMSTARELVILLQTAEQNEIIAYYTTQPFITITQASGRSVTVENTNTLLTTFMNEYPYSISGGKTGYLPQAGYVLATTVEYEGDKVHVIVMGAESKDARVSEAKGLAYWAFKTYQWPE